ncbi:MAG: DUF3429 domain-containing protein [Gammaproteobacteria bacterium]
MTDKDTHNPLYNRLAWAGTLPFAACALLVALGVPAIDGLGSWPVIAAGYGLAIASFMAGVHWGIYLQQSATIPLNLLVISNIVTVTVWLSFVLLPVVISLTVTATAFVLLLLVDLRLGRIGVLSPEYITLRRNVTTVVLVLLAITVALS